MPKARAESAEVPASPSLEREALPRLREGYWIETPKADIFLHLASHNERMSAEFVRHVDAIALESATFFEPDNKPRNRTAGDVLPKGLKDHQYAEIFKLAVDTQKPIFFTDVSGDSVGILSLLQLVAGLGLEVAAVGSAAHVTQRALKIDDPITRRQWAGAAMGSVIGLYIGALGLCEAARHSGAELAYRTANTVGRIDEFVHPISERNLIVARNLMIATKALSAASLIAERGIERPKIALVVGSRHVTILGDFEATEAERSARLRASFGGNIEQHDFLPELRGTGDGAAQYIVHRAGLPLYPQGG